MARQIRKTFDHDEGYRLGESLAELTQYTCIAYTMCYLGYVPPIWMALVPRIELRKASDNLTSGERNE